MNKAVFLDRDGTINVDTGYIGDPDLVELYNSVSEGIDTLKKKFSFIIIVVSNQSGIARGLISEEDVKNVNSKINMLLNQNDTAVDAFYFCPHHPDFSASDSCTCRKPSPDMLIEAAGEFNIDLKKSYMIGDKISDIECAFNAGVKSILVKNTISEVELNELKKSKFSPNFIADNFMNAVKFIENDISGEFIEN